MSNRLTQRERILALLRSRLGQWVALPEITGLGIAMYPPRIKELRDAGHDIENRLEHLDDGSIHSFYRLHEPARDWYTRETGQTRPSLTPVPKSEPVPDFGPLFSSVGRR